MMWRVSHVLRPNYDQIFLLPPSLEDWVPPGHPVRFVRDFVDALDLKKLGFREPDGKEGRPPFATDLLLKVWLFGWMRRIRSTRALEQACLERMPFLWLTGNLHPDHNTIWRFFRDNRKALRPLFKDIVRVAAEADLVGFALHALDGTKMTAACATDGALHRKGLEERLKEIDPIIEDYVTEVQATGEQEETAASYMMPAPMQDPAKRNDKIRATLKRRIEAQIEAGREASDVADTDKPTPKAQAEARVSEAQALKTQLTEELAKLDAAKVDHLHEQEPEARMMKGRSMYALGYNAQAVVDHDSDLVVAIDVVTQENDQGQLVPMLEQVRDTLGRLAEQTDADGGYCSGEQLAEAERHSMPVLVAIPEEVKIKGAFSKSHFRYNAEDNVYVCPRGEVLMQIGTSKARASSSHADAIYRCNNRSCPVRSDCTDSPVGRKIRRPPFEDALVRQAHKQQDPQMRILLSLRKEIIEHLFGITKGIDNFRRFTVRGIEKVQAQWALMNSAVNLRKLHPFWLQGKLRLGAKKTPGPNIGVAVASAA